MTELRPGLVDVQEHEGAGWESANVAYMCLRDRARTLVLRDGIRDAVADGATVVDIGAGTGILSLFAAQAGAGAVYSVEGDRLLADSLCSTVRRNGYSDVIQVIHGDARDVEIDDPIDLVISETLDTGLIGECLIPVHNAVVSNCNVTPATQFIPTAYETWMQPAQLHDDLFGFEICAPRHEWSFFKDPSWMDVETIPLGERAMVWRHRLSLEPVPDEVQTILTLPRGADALLITGRVQIGATGWWGDFPSMNGPKVLALPDDCIGPAYLSITYRMGGGLESVDCRRLAD